MEREELEKKYGTVWSTAEATKDFAFTSFSAPFVFVVRRSDDKAGTLDFQHSPRLYFNFMPQAEK